MAGFVAGLDRGQTTLLPEYLEDWVDENNSVRAVDVFVEALDLRDLGFERRRCGRDWPALVSPWCAAQTLHLRLFEPRAIEPSSRTRGRPQSRGDVADRTARAGSQNHRRLPQGQWSRDQEGLRAIRLQQRRMTATAATFVASRPVLQISTLVVHVQIECGRIWRWRVLCTNA